MIVFIPEALEALLNTPPMKGRVYCRNRGGAGLVLYSQTLRAKIQFEKRSLSSLLSSITSFTSQIAGYSLADDYDVAPTAMLK